MLKKSTQDNFLLLVNGIKNFYEKNVATLTKTKKISFQNIFGTKQGSKNLQSMSKCCLHSNYLQSTALLIDF